MVCQSSIWPSRVCPDMYSSIWMWPIGSGEVYGYRMDKKMPPEVRAGVTFGFSPFHR